MSHNNAARVFVMCRRLAVCAAIVASISACSSGRTETVLTVDVTSLRQQTSAYEDTEPASDVDRGVDGAVAVPPSNDAGAD